MATIYRKTDKGRAEIETRAHRLPPRLRSALIVVDGRRSDADLARLIQQSDDVLEALLEQGFVDHVEPDDLDVSLPIPLSAPIPLSSSRPAAVAAKTALAVGSNLMTRRREAVRMLTDIVGPVCEALALRIEKASDEPTLRPLLVLARDSIRNVRGAAAARDFEVRFLG